MNRPLKKEYYMYMILILFQELNKCLDRDSSYIHRIPSGMRCLFHFEVFDDYMHGKTEDFLTIIKKDGWICLKCILENSQEILISYYLNSDFEDKVNEFLTTKKYQEFKEMKLIVE